MDYSALARIRATPSNRLLLLRYFDSLCSKVQDRAHGEDRLVKALSCSLQFLDAAVFGDDTRPLQDLAGSLLSKLDPS